MTNPPKSFNEFRRNKKKVEYMWQWIKTANNFLGLFKDGKHRGQRLESWRNENACARQRGGEKKTVCSSCCFRPSKIKTIKLRISVELSLICARFVRCLCSISTLPTDESFFLPHKKRETDTYCALSIDSNGFYFRHHGKKSIGTI